MSTQGTSSWALWKHKGTMVQYSCKNIRNNYKIGKMPKRKKITLYKEENDPKKGTIEESLRKGGKSMGSPGKMATKDWVPFGGKNLKGTHDI